MSIKFNFTIGSSFNAEVFGLEEYDNGERNYFYYGLRESEFEHISKTESVEAIASSLAEVTDEHFVLFIYDQKLRSFYAFNDRFGHNEIYLSQNKSDKAYQITSDVKNSIELDPNAVREYLIFHSILPPRTIYAEVETVPMASYVEIKSDTDKFDYKRYWKIEELFNPKASNYEELTKSLQKACLAEIKNDYGENAGVALSGGIDSGGILGMMSEVADESVLSFSFGPHGPGSNDLESSRKTVEYFNSNNTELYPSNKSFDFLFTNLPKLNQPVPPDILLPVCHLYESAQKSGIQTLFTGYGTQATLGNLYFNQMWHRLRWIDLFVPKFIKRTLYKAYAHVKNLSPNQKKILMTDNWVKRFLYNQGALYNQEKSIYKQIDEDFIEKIADYYKPFISNQALKLSDRFVLLYIFGWTILGQERVNPMIAKQFEVKYRCPYNSRNVVEVILKTPDTFRKKNKWNKQLWRDVLKPFVPSHLYQRKGKSLVVPYTKIFNDELSRFLPYLESHSQIGKYVDLQKYKEQFHTLPEPGLNLLRLVGFGIWLDARYDQEHLKLAKKSFSGFDFDNKMASR